MALSLPNSFAVLQVYCPSWSAVAFERVRIEEELVVSTDASRADRGVSWKSQVTFGGGAPMKVQVRISSNPRSVICVDVVMDKTRGSPAMNEMVRRSIL